MPLIPQLILSLAPDGSLIAEAPSQNGSRRKLVLEEGWELTALRAELLDQRQRLEAQARREAEAARAAATEKSQRVFARLIMSHGRDFAERVTQRSEGRMKAPSALAKEVSKLPQGL